MTHPPNPNEVQSLDLFSTREVCSECGQALPRQPGRGRPRKTCAPEHARKRANRRKRKTPEWEPAIVENAADRKALDDFNRFAKWRAP